jgi:uncharacterized membrane protein YccC
MDRESLRPDLGRAVRGTVALAVPLALALTRHLHLHATYVVLAAMNIATVDVRGAYSLRLALLVCMTAVLGASAGLGGFVSESMPLAVLAMGLVAILGGLWRHLSSDYGPSLSIASTLIFALGLAGHGGAAAAGGHAVGALAGGAWGLALQVMLWPIRSQHPLRRTVSDTWLALADLFAAMAVDAEAGGREHRVLEAESRLNASLESTGAALGAVKPRPRTAAAALSDLNAAAGQLATQAGALEAAIEALMGRPDFAEVAPSFAPVMTAFTNTSRTVALAVVSRQPSHLGIVNLRLRRLRNLLSVLAARAAARTRASDEAARLGEVVRKITGALPAAEAALRSSTSRAGEREAFSLELFDMDTWRLRPLAAAVDFSLRVDPAMVRFSLRSAALTMLGVLALMELHLRHGYWLPFTMMVVLQPDYGSTRQKAFQRVLGTVAGSVLASLILHLSLPAGAAFGAAVATGFAFYYLLKRHYGVSVVFITLFVVLLTETGGAVDIWFTVERLATTVAGGLAALLAAFLFWPTWERNRFPPILASAFRANRAYLDALTARISEGGPPDAASLGARRRAEAANGAVFSSLRRMSGDPGNRPEEIERSAALANGNQRFTRALNAILLHMEPGPDGPGDPVFADFRERAGQALEALAAASESGRFGREELDALRAGLDGLHTGRLPDGRADPVERRRSWILAQLGSASTELGAMLVA